MALSTGITFGLLAMVAWGLSKVFVKGAVDRLGHRSALFFNYVFFIIIIGSIVPFTTTLTNMSLNSWKIFAFAIPIGALGIYSMFRGLQIGKTSLLFPIAHSSVIITTVLSLIFFQENLSHQQMGGLIVIIIGIIFISFEFSDLKKLNFQKSIPGGKYAVLTMICWGLWFFLIKFIIDDVGPMAATLYLEGGVTLLIGTIIFFSSKKLRRIKCTKKGLWWAAGAGIFGGAGSLLYNMGVFNEANAIINTLGQASLLIAVVGSYFILKERIEKNQKIAIGIILLGILLISV